jgi:hypothetical protein
MGDIAVAFPTETTKVNKKHHEKCSALDAVEIPEVGVVLSPQQLFLASHQVVPRHERLVTFGPGWSLSCDISRNALIPNLCLQMTKVTAI